MARSSLFTLALAAMLCSGDKVYPQQWEPLGPDDNNWPCDADLGDDGFALDPTGKPVIAVRGTYPDLGITVRRWSGSQWYTVGPVGFANSYSDPCLAIDNSGGLFVAYQDPDDDYRISVRHWTGGFWQLVGAPGFTLGNASPSGLEINAEGRPVVAFRDDTQGYRASVWLWTGVDWEPIGSSGFSMDDVDYLDLAMDAAGDPVVAYRDNANGKRTTVQRWNGIDWNVVGVAGFSPDSANHQDVAVDANGNPVVIYKEIGLTHFNHATVQRWDGMSWAFVGARAFSEHWASNLRIAFGPAEEPIVAYLDDSSGAYRVKVQKWSGSDWQQYGAGDGSEGSASVGLAISPSGDPLVGFTNLSYGRRTTVQQWSGGTWVVLGELGFSVEGTIAEAKKVGLVLDPSAKPVVAYSDAAHSNKLTVQRWNGTSWQRIGPVGFAQGGGSSCLTIDPSGRLLIAHQDGPYGKATVRRWNGTAWDPIGPAQFSPMQAYDLDLAVDLDGDPTVAYRDRANGYKTTVQRWNGSTWELVGPAGFTTDAAENQTLVLDVSGNPIVAHRYGSQHGAHVHRWNGSSWQELGGAPAYSTSANSIGLTLDNMDAPILAYVSYSLNAGVTVRRWNGTAWELLGVEGFASTGSSNLCLTTDAAGSPLLGYVDNGVTVQRWSGSSWEVVGSPSFSAAVTSDSKHWLQVDEDGRAIVAYASGGIYAKAYPDAHYGITISDSELNLGPNPTTGEDLWISLGGLSTTTQNVEAELHDMSGRRVSAQLLPANGQLNTKLVLPPGLANGMYVATVSAGDSRWSARLVVAKP